jgi:NADPH:quinone reductase-like Zn-dependent oxidoreductase
VWPLFAEGRLSPQLAETFPIKDAEAAFAAWRATGFREVGAGD